MDARLTRTPEQMFIACGNIGYEVQMCCEQSARLLDTRVLQATATGYEPDWIIANALIEAHLLHARSLTEFLVRPLPRQPGATDMLRTDFTPGVADWSPTPGHSAAWLSTHWKDMNRHLAHLSWARDHIGPSWQYDRMAHHVLAVTNAWTHHLQAHVGGAVTRSLRGQVLLGRQALGRAAADWNALTTDQRASIE